MAEIERDWRDLESALDARVVVVVVVRDDARRTEQDGCQRECANGGGRTQVDQLFDVMSALLNGTELTGPGVRKLYEVAPASTSTIFVKCQSRQMAAETPMSANSRFR